MLGLVRDAEQQFRSALRDCKSIEIVLRLVRVYIRLDQPLAALELCKKGLEYFPNDVGTFKFLYNLLPSLFNYRNWFLIFNFYCIIFFPADFNFDRDGKSFRRFEQCKYVGKIL